LIVNDENSDPLYIMLQRAVYEAGTKEGESAWAAFKRKVKGQKGKVVFLTKDFDNPLMFIVDEHEKRITALEAENKTLQETINSSGIIMKKKPEKNFPWHEYPDVEEQAMRMIFERSIGNQDVIEFIDKAVPALAGKYTTHVNARFVKGRPGRFNADIAVPTGSAPTTWLELWKIATFEYGEGWIKRVMRYANAWAKFRDKNGNIPKGWNRSDPNKFIKSGELAKLRDRFHRGDFPTAKVELLSEIEKAGQQGLTKKQIIDLGLEQRRLQEIVKTDEIFMEGDRYVHYAFAPHFPSNLSARIAADKHLLELKVHGSEHREGRQKRRKTASAA
jgi:hypothetical protein